MRPKVGKRTSAYSYPRRKNGDRRGDVIHARGPGGDRRAKVVTHMPWREGAVAFEGVQARELTKKVVVKGDRIAIATLDNDSVAAPIADFDDDGVVFAHNPNGKPMSMEDKGPLFLIYPFDAEPAPASETCYSRSIWQIARITVE